MSDKDKVNNSNPSQEPGRGNPIGVGGGAPNGHYRVGGDNYKPGDDNKDIAKKILQNKILDIVANNLAYRRTFLDQFKDDRRNLNQECGYPETIEQDPWKYQDLFDRDPIANRVIEIWPMECWQSVPKITEYVEGRKEAQQSTFEKSWDNLGRTVRGLSFYQDEEGSIIWEYLKRADILSGIGQFGIILLGIDDGLPLSMPAKAMNPMDLAGPDGQVSFGVPQGADRQYYLPLAPQGYGYGSYALPGYPINPNSGMDIVGNPSTGSSQMGAQLTPTGFFPGGQGDPLKATGQGNLPHNQPILGDQSNGIGQVPPLHAQTSQGTFDPLSSNYPNPYAPHSDKDHPSLSQSPFHSDTKEGPTSNPTDLGMAYEYWLQNKPIPLDQVNPSRFGVRNPDALIQPLDINPNENVGSTRGIPDKGSPGYDEYLGKAFEAGVSQQPTSDARAGVLNPVPGTTPGSNGDIKLSPTPYGERTLGSEGQGYNADGLPVQGPTPPQGQPQSATSDSGQTGQPTSKLLFVRVFPESLVRVTQYETNVLNPRFGQPVQYLVTLNDPRIGQAGIGLTTATINVHWTRVVHIADNLTSSEVFGIPRCQAVLNRLLDLQKLYGGSAEMYWKGAFPGLSLETQASLGGDVDIDPEIIDQLEAYMNGLQRYLQTSGMTAKSLAVQVSDPTPQITCALEAICIKIACPVRVFKGSERGEMASSQDDSKWNDRVRERQVNHVTPRVIVPFVDRLIMLGVLPRPKGYSVTWPDLDSQTDTERAQIGQQRAQTMATYISSNASTLMDPMTFFVHVMGFDEDVSEAIITHMDEVNKKPGPWDGIPQDYDFWAGDDSDLQGKLQQAAQQGQQGGGGQPPSGNPEDQQQPSGNPTADNNPQQGSNAEQTPKQPTQNEFTYSFIDNSHKFSSTQISLPYNLTERIKRFGRMIPDEFLAGDGRETDIHVTVKYGLHTTNPNEVEDIIKSFGDFPITLGRVSIFEGNKGDEQRGGDSFDVVKVDIDSPALMRLNKELCNLDHTDTHPKYVPHITIAYLKPGKGKQYIGMDDFKGDGFVAKSVIFSSRDGVYTEIPLSNPNVEENITQGSDTTSRQVSSFLQEANDPETEGKALHQTYNNLVCNCGGKGGKKGPCPLHGQEPGTTEHVGPSKPEARNKDAKPIALPWKDPPPPKGKNKDKGSNAERPKGEESQTKTGDLAELVATKLGFRSILPEGQRSHKAGENETKGSTIDLEYDHSGKAYELKMCNVESTEYRLKAKAKEKEQKEKFAEQHELKAHVMIAVRDKEKGEIHFYAGKEPGLTGATVSPKSFDYVGTVKISEEKKDK